MDESSVTSRADSELFAIRDRWTAERPERWQQVIRHKGLEYEREYDAFMAMKAEAEAAVAELRRRGLIRRGRPPGGGDRRRSSDAARQKDFTSSFVFSHSARGVRAGADAHVRFGERDRLALRAAIGAATARLRFAEGEILRCVFLGQKPTAGTDVENLTLYNLGLRHDLVGRGVAFEHLDEAPPDASVGYVYEPVPADDALREWRSKQTLISWSEVPLAEMTAPATWWALRRAGEPGSPAAPADHLLIECTIAAPGNVGVEAIKGIVDGAVAAAQWMPAPPPERCELVASILGRVLPDKPTGPDVMAALSADERSVLGPCATLVPADGRINPDDHRLVAGVVRVQPSDGGAPRLSVSLHTAERTRSP